MVDITPVGMEFDVSYRFDVVTVDVAEAVRHAGGPIVHLSLVG